jgi:hypothetical protein
METNSQYGTQWTADIRGLKAAIQKTSSGKPQIVVEAEVLDGEFKGQKLQYRGLLNPDRLDQTEKTIDALHALGCVDFGNDPFGPNAFKGMGKTARGIIAKEPDQNGVERPTIKFINANTLVRPESLATPEDNSAWRNQFAGSLKEIRAKKAASAPAPRTSSPAASGEAGTGDDDVQF